MQRATIWARLGRTREGLGLWEQVIPDIPASSRRDLGVFRARQAQALAAAGEPEQAVTIAREVVPLDTTGISKDYRIDYDTAIRITGEIGQAAIELEHRPDIDIRWDLLRIFLTTHTARDVVTELDFLLAARIDAIAAAYGAKPS